MTAVLAGLRSAHATAATEQSPGLDTPSGTLAGHGAVLLCAKRDHASMANGQEEEWSPARSPYAIAVSQSWWAFQAAVLFAADANNASGPAQQIYARQIFGQLRALRRCAEMQAKELKRLAVDETDRRRFAREIELFDAAVPAAKAGRDILEHFDEYARGEGKLQREAIHDLGLDLFEAAAMFWGGGFDPGTQQLTQGPFVIVVPDALKAAERLHRAIYAAGRAVDRRGSRGSE